MKRLLSLVPLLLLPLLARAAELVPTVVECSGLAETVSTDAETTATFHDKVVVTGNNMKIYCDFLQIIAYRKLDPSAPVSQYGAFKSLVATGHVRIVQGDREATCGRAEVFPGQDKVVLSDKPFVRSLDGQYTATGPVMELYRGQRKAVIPGTPDAPATFTLPMLKDLGPDAGKDKKTEDAPTTVTLPGAKETAPATGKDKPATDTTIKVPKP